MQSIVNMSKEKDPILSMQINTVPGLDDDSEIEEDYDRDVPPDDYQEYINNEINALNK